MGLSYDKDSGPDSGTNSHGQVHIVLTESLSLIQKIIYLNRIFYTIRTSKTLILMLKSMLQVITML